METILIQAIAGLCFVLVVLIGWLGSRLFVKIDHLFLALDQRCARVDKHLNEHEKRISHIEGRHGLGFDAK